MWQAGAVFCLLPPHVAWIEEVFEKQCAEGSILTEAALAEVIAAQADLSSAPTLSWSQTCLDGVPNY